jgi:hypothetical protein
MGTIQIQTKQKNESSDNKKKLVVGPVVGPYLSKTRNKKYQSEQFQNPIENCKQMHN